MPTPATQLRTAVTAALGAVLLPAPDWTIRQGRLHDSLGDVGNVAGVSPEEDAVGGNAYVLKPLVLVQVFLKWEKVVDNQRVVDPTPIENLADAFREECRTRQGVNTDEVWFLEVERLWYPNDPTGQKTRFHANIRGHGDNNAVILRETGP